MASSIRSAITTAFVRLFQPIYNPLSFATRALATA